MILSIFQGSLAGDGSDSGDYTPVCTKRKRRQDDDAFRNLTALLPNTVSTILTVRMNQGEKLLPRHNTEIRQREKCSYFLRFVTQICPYDKVE